jgi:hypothetical protein
MVSPFCARKQLAVGIDEFDPMLRSLLRRVGILSRTARGGFVQNINGLRLPIRHLTFGFVSGNAVAFLDLADQLIALAGYHIQLVIAQFAPLLLDLAFDLVPIAFDYIPVHQSLLCELKKTIRAQDISLSRNAVPRTGCRMQSGATIVPNKDNRLLPDTYAAK